MSTEEKPITRRGILSTVNNTFDPLGFLDASSCYTVYDRLETVTPETTYGKLSRWKTASLTVDWEGAVTPVTNCGKLPERNTVSSTVDWEASSVVYHRSCTLIYDKRRTVEFTLDRVNVTSSYVVTLDKSEENNMVLYCNDKVLTSSEQGTEDYPSSRLLRVTEAFIRFKYTGQSFRIQNGEKTTARIPAILIKTNADSSFLVHEDSVLKEREGQTPSSIGTLGLAVICDTFPLIRHRLIKLPSNGAFFKQVNETNLEILYRMLSYMPNHSVKLFTDLIAGHFHNMTNYKCRHLSETVTLFVQLWNSITIRHNFIYWKTLITVWMTAWRKIRQSSVNLST